MAHCIPTYMLASGLMASGMNWWQALITILLGNTIVLVPILLNSHPGTKYGIPFPVFARVAYGTIGSNLPALMRALVACGWFGIQAWIGGEAMHTFFTALVPGWPQLLGSGIAGHTTTEWLSFLLFWGLNVFIIYRGMDLLRWVENWAAPFVLVMTACAARLGRATGQRPRPAARPAGKAQHVRRVLSGLHPVADRDDRLLGDALAQHARLHALRPQPARADGRPGRRAADDDVGLRGDGRAHHERHGRDLRRSDLGPGQAGRTFRHAARRRDLDVHGRRRDAGRQHRGQRRLARQRLRQRVPASSSTSRPAG